MEKFSSKIVVFAAIGVAINIVFGMVVQLLNIPLLFLDTLGTIMVAVLFGPVWGALVGLVTNLLLGMLVDPTNIPFALVNIAIGIIVGLIFKKFEFNLVTAIVTGLIISVVAPLIGTPIAVFLFGGIAGGFSDVLFAWLLASGQEIFAAAFIPRILSNVVDKTLSCVLIYFVIKKIPAAFLQHFKLGINSKCLEIKES
ncbi:CD3073 family putative ECF transporter S component [Acetobacterium sp.]|jgi:energy-coupling factor transport system substrate-specific component|uniref:CD3073 family putative ECF transporter S component n=1 Tax=Acetobacterium sp. TaxID=1872094 RepID=UPI000CAE35B0|nr:CD3073 family putative ECF transporter S component [Acetobacterium sp.]MDO9493117.1 ECF transporter S component [Acetobacterium sp.]PKM73048.1 MAG: ECF transporter S component [Firmicutes bacterium HGW-Firmicutes-17]